MPIPLELTGLTRVFATPAGAFVAVKDVNARIRAGEFVSIVGNPGCGKSTVLALLAGLDRATLGGVLIDGIEVTGPGAERAVVFSGPYLLPWLTAEDNVALAVRARLQRGRTSRGDRRAVARGALARVGMASAATRIAGALDAVSQLRVAIARALVTEPRVLLLDDPFNRVAEHERPALQDLLLDVAEPSGMAVVMVTRDIDEALYLSDRLLLMTDGPGATVGDDVELPFPRPRARADLRHSPGYRDARLHVADFLTYRAHESRPSPLDDVLRRMPAGRLD